MTALLPLEQLLRASWPPEDWRDVTVVAAVSGGADSVALACAMARVKSGGAGRLIVAHLNHGLRGAESDADEAFVRKLSEDLGLACEVGTADVRAEGTPDGIEAAARDARYEFLRQTAERVGARYVATAHTADDQAETILHRVVRGTGLAGLAGMPRARPLGDAATLIRPMLALRRTQVLAYLDERERSFRYDTSNEDLAYTRNRIRHTLLPLLELQFNPAAVEALLRLGTLAGESQAVTDELAERYFRQAVDDEQGDMVALRTSELAEAPRYVVREVLVQVWRRQGWPRQAMGFRQWEQLAAMVVEQEGEPGKRILPGNVTVQRRRDRLFLSREA